MPRMTVRRWMLAVAVIALTMAGLVLLGRSYLYVKRAESCERRAEGAGIRHRYQDKFGIFDPGQFDADGNMKPEYAELYELLRITYERLARKYRHAAWHPWEAVEPDPPFMKGHL